MILTVNVIPSTLIPITSICTVSLKKESDSPAIWEKISSLSLKNPEKVMNEMLEMLEDIAPTGKTYFELAEPNGIKEYAQANADKRGTKLWGEKFDPEQRKLEIFASCASSLDNAISKYVEAQGFMLDLYRHEPAYGLTRATYMAKNKKRMPHWTNPTDEAFLIATWELDRKMNGIRDELEAIGETTPPEKYQQTIASLIANLHIVQMMDIEIQLKL
jgi:hypothetical protein